MYIEIDSPKPTEGGILDLECGNVDGIQKVQYAVWCISLVNQFYLHKTEANFTYLI